jgi:tetratricopeptide (TPR) repeat protein
MSHSTVSGIFGQLNVPPAALTAYRTGRAAAAQQHYDEAIQHYSQALNLLEAPAIFRARAFEQRGECEWLLGNYTAAADDFRSSLMETDDRGQRARSRARLGDVADSQGHYAEALSLYTEALKEGAEANDLVAIGRAQRGLGIVNRRQGSTEKAISHLTQALAAFRQAGDAREQGRVLTSLGITRHAQGEYQQAVSAHTEALNILEALKDRWRVVFSLNNIGECYQALYDLEKAYEYHARALKLAEQYVQGSNIIKPDIQRNLGIDLVELGRAEEGLTHLQQALLGAREMGNREQEGLTLHSIARAYLGQNSDLETAAAIVTELSEIADSLNADRFRALAAFVRGELLFAQGNRPAAAAELNAAMLAAQTSLDRGVLWKLHATMSHVVDDKGIAAVHTQIAADFVCQIVEPLQDPRLKASFINAAPVMAVLVAAGIDPDKLLRES